MDRREIKIRDVCPGWRFVEVDPRVVRVWVSIPPAFPGIAVCSGFDVVKGELVSYESSNVEPARSHLET
jgi:hypothetical protein